MPRILLPMGTMLVLLVAILVFALQLNRQQMVQQETTVQHLAHIAVRNTAQLEREHLRLYAIISAGADRFTQESFAIQRDLVWSRLHVLETPYYRTSSPDIQQAFDAYKQAWEALQPQLDEWVAAPTNATLQVDLLAKLYQMDLGVNTMVRLSQVTFEERLAAWADSSQRVNRLLTSGIIVSIILVIMMSYTGYHILRNQWKAQEQLRASEQRLRAILDTIPDAVFRIKRDGTYVAFKPAQNFKTLVESEQFIGKKFTDILPSELAEASTQAAARALDTGEQQLLEYELWDPAANSPHNFEARIISSGSDEVQAIVRDITQEKRDEEAELQAQKLESLGVLAGGIAHDFNNLLTGMMGQSSLAKAKLAKGLPAVDHIDKAIISAERAADLTRQLLAYAGKGKFQIGDLDLNRLIRDTAGLLATALPNRAELQLNLTDFLPMIQADPGQIQQVVMNLVINAAEALGKEGGYVQIITYSQRIAHADDFNSYIRQPLRPGCYVTLVVRDNGLGMDQATLHRIFDPFFSTKKHGHGLGLSATLGIINTHQGGLQVESHPGEGTTFTIVLPALEQTTATPTSKISVAPTNGAHAKSILVIDDEIAVRESVVDTLVSNDLGVITAVNGEDGVEKFRQLQEEIGVVLLDMKMPGISGAQVYQILRQINPAVKIILMSGYSETEMTTHFDHSGPVIFLPKPFTATALLQHVNAVPLA